MSLTIPACLLAGFAPSSDVLFVARVLGGLAGGHGLPDDARADHGAVVGPGADEVDRALVGARRGDRPARAAHLRRACSSTSTGARSSSSRCRSSQSRCRWRSSSCPSHVNEATEPVDNLGGLLSAVFVGGLIVAINFLPVPNETDARARPARGRGRGRRSCSSCGSAGQPTRSTTCTSPRARRSGSPPARGSSSSAR